uniref:Sperm microtubule inner protein 1 C-terminal domain-containing protein n=1 Tax=Sphaeramia orbicularis TaxID=375764 RepID=A0A672YHE4_9TELE
MTLYIWSWSKPDPEPICRNPTHSHKCLLQEQTFVTVARKNFPLTGRNLEQTQTPEGWLSGRSQYLWRRGQMKPEEKFDFPLLTSWEYGWRLDNYTLDYRTPCCARSSVVKNTFYARNGVFNSPSATDTLG